VIVDAHVHFWDPAALHYPWLDAIPPLDRAFLPSAYRGAAGEIPVSRIVFVEANCRPDEAAREVAWVERLAEAEPRIAGIVAFADLTAGLGAGDSGLGAGGSGLGCTLDGLCRAPLVKGIRQNIQGQPAGFCVQRAFVDGVREVGRRGLTFDLCGTHDQLGEVVQLVRQCPDTRFVLDHCGKPAIRDQRTEPWRGHIAALAAQDNVSCKLSGLLTEAAPEGWSDDALVPYAAWVVESFGAERVMYGSDWPVVTLAGSYCDWYGFTERITSGWSAVERSHFYEGNATRVYGL
jgi:predicted TIM-barrel fold metal-dependent hydrolase